MRHLAGKLTSEMKKPHTPRPWTNGIGPCGITGPNNPSCLGVTCGEHIDIHNWKLGEPYPKSQHIPITKGMDTIAIAVGEDREGNAELITRAVNCHDELLAALKYAHDKIIDDMRAEAQGRFRMSFDNANIAVNINPLVILIRAAIKKAEDAK